MDSSTPPTPPNSWGRRRVLAFPAREPDGEARARADRATLYWASWVGAVLVLIAVVLSAVAARHESAHPVAGGLLPASSLSAP